MIKICIFLFLPFTSVLAYPSVHKNIDGYELSNEFLIRHFGADFKDAVRFNIQQTGVPNTANMLQKHFPVESNTRRNFKRSYQLPTQQIVRQENPLPDNFMKVQLLSPGEVEALEREIKGKGMYKSPIVVTLPEFGGVAPKTNFNNPKPFLPYAQNTAPVPAPVPAPVLAPVIYQNNLHSKFLPNNQGTRSQNPSAVYQQPSNQQPFIVKTTLPSFDRFAFQSLQPSAMPQRSLHSESNQMKTTQPLFEKFAFQSLLPSHQSNLNTKSEQIASPQQESKINQPLLLNRLVESSTQPSISVKPTSEKLPNSQSTLEQTLKEHYLEEKINESVLEETTDSPIEVIVPSTDEKQTSIDKIQPLTEILEPVDQNVQSSIDDMHLLIDETPKIQPSTNNKQHLNDNIQPATATIDKIHQFPSERIQSSSELINPSNIAIKPFYRKVQATFEKTPESYSNMGNLGFEEFNPLYNTKATNIDENKKQIRYEDHPAFQSSRMISYDKSSSSDASRQSSYDKNFERALDSFDGVRFEYRNDKKTNL